MNGERRSGRLAIDGGRLTEGRGAGALSDRHRSTVNGQRAAGLRAVARCLWPVAIVLAMSGCGNIEPWVKPYERQNLADPVMAFELNPVSSSYMDHVFEAREGARGALGGGGGGCGCN